MATKIHVLGPGCAKCTQLANNVNEAVSDLGVDASVEKVTDINQFVSFGVMMTPGLVIDGQVKSSGKVPSVDQIKGWLA